MGLRSVDAFDRLDRFIRLIGWSGFRKWGGYCGYGVCV